MGSGVPDAQGPPVSRKYQLLLRTQPEDPTQGDILQVDGWGGPPNGGNKSAILRDLSRVSSRARTTGDGPRTASRDGTALVSVPARDQGGGGTFSPTITIALREARGGHGRTPEEVVAEVIRFAQSLDLEVDRPVVQEHVSALIAALRPRCWRAWRMS